MLVNPAGPALRTDADQQPGAARPAPTRSRPVSVLVVVVMAGRLAWAGCLAHALPARHDACVPWAGFDVALLVVLASTAWAAWFWHQIAVGGALVTGTLLLCDTWLEVISASAPST